MKDINDPRKKRPPVPGQDKNSKVDDYSGIEATENEQRSERTPAENPARESRSEITNQEDQITNADNNSDPLNEKEREGV